MAGERAFTAFLRRFFPRDPRRVPVGIGDDAAVVRTRDRTVVACDPTVEGVHFTPRDPLARVGAKALNRNLSDLAAMGATADYAVVSVLLPRWVGDRGRRALFGGLRRAAARAGCAVVGGDTGATPGPLTLTITVLGHLRGDRALLRSTLRIGDRLHVTGPLGGSRLGHHLRFEPRIAAGRWLAERAGVRCAIDVSDGLLLDLGALLRASAVPGAVLDEAAIPIRAAARRSARQTGETALRHALTDGEDYELLFAVRPRRPLPAGGPLAERARRPIGTAEARPGLRLRRRDGSIVELAVEGYEHDLSRS